MPKAGIITKQVILNIVYRSRFDKEIVYVSVINGVERQEAGVDLPLSILKAVTLMRFVWR
ncbi:hypothetical protein OK016_02590 [Vibrio chagasii]|nr:hypothetical protein [Vibrio chagasii]